MKQNKRRLIQEIAESEERKIEKNGKRKKKIIIITSVLIGIVIAAIWGAAVLFLPAEEEGGNRADYYKRKEEKVRTIAIVNQDTGVTTEGGTTNYGTQLLTDLEENFRLVGLEEARTGIENGSFGAYIIIPSSFSQSVESLNHTPQKAKIEFALNTNLDAATAESVALEAVSFVNGLNYNLSYMYINSVLQEFHTSQDAAATVMENDRRDTEVILKIKPTDLVELVAIPELERKENTTEPFDAELYIERNTELVETVNHQYEQYISMSKDDFEHLNQQGSQLLEQWKGMETVIGNIRLEVDANGSNVYEKGVEDTKALLGKHNERLAEFGTKVGDLTQSMSKTLEEMKTGQMNHVQEYNNSIEDAKNGIDGLKNSYIYPAFTAKEDGICLLGEQISSLSGLNQMDVNVREQVIGKWMARMQLVIDYQKCQEMLPDNNMDSVFVPDFALVEDAGYQSLEEAQNAIINGTWSEGFSADIQTMQKTIDYNATVEEINEILKQKGVKPAEVFAIEVETVKNSFAIYENKYEIQNKEGMEEYVEVNQAIDTLIRAIQEFGDTQPNKIDSDCIEGVLYSGIIQPFTDRTDEVTGRIKEQYEKEKAEYEEYNSALLNFDPLKYINEEELNETKGEMEKNSADLQEAVNEHDNSMTEYVAEVEKTAHENTDMLVKHIEEAKKTSEQTVTEGLLEAQTVKNETSNENQTLLYDFTQKLPYTRIGSLEYKQVNEFMASPLEITRKYSEENETTAEQRVSEEKDLAEGSKDRGVEDLRKVLLIIGGIIALTILLTAMRMWYEKRKSA